LGEGGQGRTFRVRDLNEGGTSDWVLKTLKNQKRIGRFEREIAAQRRLTSPNIARIEAAGFDPEPFLVTPYLGKDLDKLPDLSEPDSILKRFRGIHRDIKPSNVVVGANETPYLIDFGICADDEDADKLTAIEAFGNRAFAAPECELGSVESAREPSDVYSLGKLLYWMSSGRKHIAREDFDPFGLTVADIHAKQYISTIVDHTVRHETGARWTASQVIEQVDWALAKLTEHSAIRQSGSAVLVDNFGPNDTCNESGSRSAKSGHGDPPKDYDIAHSFLVAQAAVLERLDIRLARQHGSGRVELTLIRGGDEVPSDESEDVVEQWLWEITSPRNALKVSYLPSQSGIALRPLETYWLRLVARDDNSNIEWMSGPIELMPQVSRFADRPRGSGWTPRVSPSGPCFAFRVLARPLDATDDHPGTG
jgi:serine/threonine protein kinase